MPQPLSFIKLRDAEYVDQFAGSVVPELKDAQKVLNERYDLAEENDSKRAAVAREMMQNVADKDKGQAQLAYKRAMDDIAANQARGDYENMYGKTANSARQFSVNAAKFIGEKKRIDEALKAIDEDKNKTAEEKAEYKKMTLANQEALQFDPQENIVKGLGYKSDTFADDPQISLLTNELYGKGIEHEGSAYGKARLYREPSTGMNFILKQDGRKEYLEDAEAERIVSGFINSNPKVQSYLDTRTRAALHDAYGEDPRFNWRTIDQTNPIYQDVRGKMVDRYVTPVVKSSGEKWGFNKVITENEELGQLNHDYLKASSGKDSSKNPEKLPQLMPFVAIAGNNDLPEITLDDIEGAKNHKDYNEFLKQKGLSGKDSKDKTRVTFENDFRILSSNKPLQDKLNSLTTTNPLLKDVMNTITKSGVKLTEQNLVTAYNEARKMLQHKYPLAETHSPDLVAADREALFGKEASAAFPTTTQAMMFKDAKTGKIVPFRELELPESVSETGFFGFGMKTTVGDILDSNPEKILKLKSVMSSPQRLVPFGNRGGIGFSIGDNTYTSVLPLTTAQGKQNEDVYLLNEASYGTQGGSKPISVQESFLKDLFPGVNKVQAVRETLVDKNGNFLGFKTNVYELTKTGRNSKPLASLDEVNNYFRTNVMTASDPFNYKGMTGSGADYEQTKEELEQERSYRQ